MSHGACRKAGQSAALMVTPRGGLCISYSMTTHRVVSGTTRGDLIQGDISSSFIESRASLYGASVHVKISALASCVGLIDGTVIGIARPCDSNQQNVAYNGHKRKHALKFQAVSTSDGLFLHTFGRIEGRRHDWTFYMQSGIEEQL